MSLTSDKSSATSKDETGIADVYVLKTGKVAAKTLKLQHQTLAEDSYEHLGKAGLKAGQIVWDIGCGSGLMTEYIAKAVGETGHVYAMDVSSEQIEISRKNIERAGLKNVTFLQEEITSAENLPLSSADIIYARFLLMHLRKPEEALKKMHLLSKPLGVVVLQESIMSTSHTSTKNAAIEEYINTSVALGKHKGVNFNIGSTLHQLCEDAGFKKVQSYYLQRKLPTDQSKKLLLERCAEWGEEAVKAEIVTQKQIEGWRSAIRSFPESDPSFYYASAKQAYILAWKK